MQSEANAYLIVLDPLLHLLIILVLLEGVQRIDLGYYLQDREYCQITHDGLGVLGSLQ